MSLLTPQQSKTKVVLTSQDIDQYILWKQHGIDRVKATEWF